MEDFGLRLQDSDKNKILKLIGIIDALVGDCTCGTIVAEYVDADGNPRIEVMDYEAIDAYTENVWSMIQ